MWEGGVHIYGTPRVPNNFPEFRPYFSLLGKFGALNVEIGGSEEQAKFSFPVPTVTVCKGKLKKKSYLTQLWSELSYSYTKIEAPDV